MAAVAIGLWEKIRRPRDFTRYLTHDSECGRQRHSARLWGHWTGGGAPKDLLGSLVRINPKRVSVFV